MRRSIGDRVRAEVRAAVRELGASVSPAKLEQRLREGEPGMYAEWRRATPELSDRLAFLTLVIAGERPRKAPPARGDGEVNLWPIGSRQRWDLLTSTEAIGSPPDPTESRFYLHNYGTRDAVDVVVTIAGLWQEYVPRVASGETVELEWSEERVHPTGTEIPPAEERGYPDPFNPTGDRQENRCDLRVDFSVNGRARRLEGLLYFWPGHPPTFFQQTGAAEAADHARSIR